MSLAGEYGVMTEASVVPDVVMRTYAPLPKRSGLGDVRLERRVHTMVEQFGAQPNCTIPQARVNALNSQAFSVEPVRDKYYPIRL